jgi:hypothetical protein
MLILKPVAPQRFQMVTFGMDFGKESNPGSSISYAPQPDTWPS